LEKKERKSEEAKGHTNLAVRERESLKVILRGTRQSIKCIGRSPRLD